MNHEPKLVVAGVFTSVHEALFAKSVLEAAGIEVSLADEHVVSLTWHKVQRMPSPSSAIPVCAAGAMTSNRDYLRNVWRYGVG